MFQKFHKWSTPSQILSLMALKTIPYSFEVAQQSHKNMSAGEVAATLYDCHLCSHIHCEGKENFKYPSPSKNYIWAKIFPVTVWIHTKFIRECRTVSQSFPDHRSLKVSGVAFWWLSCGCLWNCHLRLVFSRSMLNDEWIANSRDVCYHCET